MHVISHRTPTPTHTHILARRPSNAGQRPPKIVWRQRRRQSQPHHRWKVNMQRKFRWFSFNLFVAIVHTILLFFHFGQKRKHFTFYRPEMCSLCEFGDVAVERCMHHPMCVFIVGNTRIIVNMSTFHHRPNCYLCTDASIKSNTPTSHSYRTRIFIGTSGGTACRTQSEYLSFLNGTSSIRGCIFMFRTTYLHEFRAELKMLVWVMP